MTKPAALQVLERTGHTPDSLYQAVMTAPAALPGWEAVARPGQRVPPRLPALEEEAVLVRVALGEPGLGCMAVLAAGALSSARQLRAAGVPVEEGPEGGYAVVDDGARVARRIADGDGCLAPGHVLLRVREGALEAEDDRDRLKDWDPAPEVPDLLVAEARALQPLLAEPDKALQYLIYVLRRGDAKRFAADDLVDGKPKVTEGISHTVQSERFAEFLKAHLDRRARALGKRRQDLSRAQVTAAVKALKLDDIPAEDRKIEVQINRHAFASMALLYSTVQHEFVHVMQLRADYLGYIPTSVMRGTPAPESPTGGPDREVEAYVWEMKNIDATGLKDPSDVFGVWSHAAEEWAKAGAQAKKTFDADFKAGFAETWTRAAKGFFAQAAEAHARLEKDGSVEDGTARSLYKDVGRLWKDRARFGIDTGWKAHEAAYRAAAAQIEALLARVVGNDFDAVDKTLAGGSLNAQEAYRVWFRLLSPSSDELPPAALTVHRDRFKVTGPRLWDNAFTGFAQQIRERIAAGDPREAERLLEMHVDVLWSKRAQSSVDEKAYAPAYRALKEEVKKAVR